MYIEGIVFALDKNNYKVRLRCEELDFETPWLSVVQKFTVVKKSGYMPEMGALLGAVLSDDMSYGAILGAIYNDIDKPLDDKTDSDFIKYEDGVVLEHKKDSKTLDAIAQLFCCSGDIKDKNGTMQAIRDYLNSHKHSNGNNGSDTGVPTTKI